LDSSIVPRRSNKRGRSSAFVEPLNVGIPVAISTGATSPLTVPGRSIRSNSLLVIPERASTTRSGVIKAATDTGKEYTSISCLEFKIFRLTPSSASLPVMSRIFRMTPQLLKKD
jgi:hypothetical protein